MYVQAVQTTAALHTYATYICSTDICYRKLVNVACSYIRNSFACCCWVFFLSFWVELEEVGGIKHIYLQLQI